MGVFSERLRALRLEQGENQADVAKMLGVSVQSYSAYEAAREPKYDMLCNLAIHYEVSVDYLVGRTDNRKPENALVVDELGLSEKSLHTITELLPKADGVDTFPKGDNRTNIDMLNGMLEQGIDFVEFLHNIKVLTSKIRLSEDKWISDEVIENPSVYVASQIRGLLYREHVKDFIDAYIMSMEEQ